MAGEQRVALSWVPGKKTKRKPSGKRKRKKPRGEAAKGIAAAGSLGEPATPARHEDLVPELLYCFAADEAPEVGREAAASLLT